MIFSLVFGLLASNDLLYHFLVLFLLSFLSLAFQLLLHAVVVHDLLVSLDNGFLFLDFDLVLTLILQSPLFKHHLLLTVQAFLVNALLGIHLTLLNTDQTVVFFLKLFLLGQASVLFSFFFNLFILVHLSKHHFLLVFLFQALVLFLDLETSFYVVL